MVQDFQYHIKMRDIFNDELLSISLIHHSSLAEYLEQP